MRQTIETKIKGCGTCLYCCTHEQCDNPECLGSCAEVESNGGSYLYKNYIEGDGIARRKEFEKLGKRNIVIGGQGEAECNTLWTFKETVKSLINVSQQCGYYVFSDDDHHTIDIYTHEGHFRLKFAFDRLDSIDKVIEVHVWTKQS